MLALPSLIDDVYVKGQNTGPLKHNYQNNSLYM